MSPKITRILPLVVLTLPGFGCSGHTAEVPRPEGPPVPLAVTEAREQSLAVTFRTSGTVRGKNTATLTSKTTGYVRAIHVRAGDRVTEGQALAELEANDARAAVARSRAALAGALDASAAAKNGVEVAQAAAAAARSSHERSAALIATHAISQQAFDDDDARFRGAVAGEEMARARERQVTAGIEEARAALAEAQAMLEYSKIVAPFAGRVLERHVDVGALATPGAPLFVIADENVVRVETAVSESHAAEVKIGDAVTVDVESSPAPLPGRVAEIVPNVDVASRAFLAKIDLEGDASPLRPGTFARVTFSAGTRGALVVPTTAINRFGALDRVFVVDDGTAHLRMIARGESDGPYTRVLAGLDPNEHVVTAPPVDLRDGTRIEVTK